MIRFGRINTVFFFIYVDFNFDDVWWLVVVITDDDTDLHDVDLVCLLLVPYRPKKNCKNKNRYEPYIMNAAVLFSASIPQDTSVL